MFLGYTVTYISCKLHNTFGTVRVLLGSTGMWCWKNIKHFSTFRVVTLIKCNITELVLIDLYYVIP